jgi:hypothetical protein
VLVVEFCRNAARHLKYPQQRKALRWARSESRDRCTRPTPSVISGRPDVAHVGELPPGAKKYMRPERIECITSRAVLGMLLSLAFSGCTASESQQERPCAASDLGCSCSATTVDDGKACAAANFQQGFCCEKEAADTCECVETACARQKDSDFCSCAFKKIHDPAEVDFVSSCPSSAGIKCCLNTMKSDIGGLCTCSILDCSSFQTQVPSCTTDIVAVCATTEPTETCE